MDRHDPLTLRRIFAFWLPLAATWLMMATEGPFLAAVIARLSEPKYNLAAFGVAFALALVVEAPIIMMMSAAVALVRDRQSYRKLRNFTNTLNALLTVAMAVLLAPPVFDLVARTLMGLPPEVAGRTHVAVAILLPWPAAIGFRRFYQGVLIGHGRTRLVAYGTVIRLLTMTITGLSLHRAGGLEGAWVGAAALSVGVTVEAAASRAMAHSIVRRLTDPQSPASAPSAEPISYQFIAHFYWPLALTSVLALGVHPVVTFFVGHARAPIESLAVLPVVSSLVFIFRALGLAYQEVAIALIGDRFEGYPALRRFGGLLAVAAAGGPSLIVWTPLAGVWFEGVSGLSPELSRFAIAPARILGLIPALTVILSFQRAILVAAKATTPVTWATLTEVVAVIGVLVVAITQLDAVGAVAAAAALLIGRTGANLYLVPPLRRLLR